MTDTAKTAAEATERISRRDSTLKRIDIARATSWTEFYELLQCLKANPDAVTYIELSYMYLGPDLGKTMANILAKSNTIEYLNVSQCLFTTETYLHFARALKTNTSLRTLYIFNHHDLDKLAIDKAFVDALACNPERPTDSEWALYDRPMDGNDFKRLSLLKE